MADIRELIEDDGWINTSFTIQVQGNDSEYVKLALDKMFSNLEQEQGIKVYEKLPEAPVELKEKWYSVYGEIKFVAKDFGRLVHTAALYSPSSVEIHDLKKVEIPLGEAQNTLTDLAALVTQMAHTIYYQRGISEKLQKETQSVPATQQEGKKSKKKKTVKKSNSKNKAKQRKKK